MDTPVTIPNTEVKHPFADGTWLVTTWESKLLPVKKNKSSKKKDLLHKLR